ncbi:McrB family protein [Exiguobacterium sp. Leaf196]|uniref:McrB family protein n=1 Tax=Exiguobacterium sp. Leaf196 TaxID=1736298 RepID=UPI0009E6E7AE|nr:AAA family ATPase [Exiguobacterium sp. Leaf196]
MSISMEPTINVFDQWLKENEGFLNEIQEPTTEDTKEFFDRLKNSGILGNRLTVEFIRENTMSNEPKRKIVNFRVMQPSSTGYVPCPHPLNPDRMWEISGVCSIKVNTSASPYYKCSYAPMRNLRTLSELVTFLPNSLKPIKLDLSERLHHLGGQALVQAAEETFGTDITTTVVEQVLRLKEEEVAIALEKLESRKISHEEEEARIKQSLEQRQQEVEAAQNQLDEQLRMISSSERQLVEMLMEIRKSEPSKEEKAPTLPFERETLLSTLQSLFYHNQDKKLLYATDKIELFLRAIQSNVLLILNGPSGTGKSSLVNAFAKALKGARSSMVPVQSSWTDKQDLLGYFSPSERRYVETPFLRALLDAKNTDGLHLICLDEMNLSHVEYYFAEFLSLREQDRPVISLYPKRYFDEASEFCTVYREKTETTYEEDIRYRDASALIAYPSELMIPDNVRFIGTLNMDHTVKPLSPKVIDRSLILELDHTTLDDAIIEEIKSNPQVGQIEVPLSELTKTIHESEQVEELADRIIELSKGLDAISDARINARGRQQLIHILQYSELTTQTLDLLLQAKLLPRIHFSTRNETAMNAFLALQSKAKTDSYSKTVQRLEKMKNNGRYINFFK